MTGTQIHEIEEYEYSHVTLFDSVCQQWSLR